MTARTVPTMPSWAAGQRVLASQLQSITTYATFWSSPPSFRMYQTAGVSPANNAYTQIPMDSVEYDSDSGRAVGTPWSYTIPSGMTGRWYFGAMVAWAANATGIRITAIYKNGTNINAANYASQAGPGTNNTSIFGSATVACAAGDVIGVYGFQNSGGGLAANSSYFEGRFASLASP